MSFFPPYYPYQQNAMQQYQQALTQSQIQNGSVFIHVQSEAQAREWPVAPNNSVTFINDNAPYCYTKSLGASSLDQPVFKRFRLLEEDDTNNQNANTNIAAQDIAFDAADFVSKKDFEPFKQQIATDAAGYLTKDEFEPYKKQINDICRRLDKLKELTD